MPHSRMKMATVVNILSTGRLLGITAPRDEQATAAQRLGSMEIPSSARRLDIEVVMEHVGAMAAQADDREAPSAHGAADATGP